MSNTSSRHLLGSQYAYPAIDLGCDLTHILTSSRRGLALSPTCQPRGKVVSTKVGCGRYGNHAGRASLRRIRGGSAMATRTPLAALIEARMQQLALDRAAPGLRLGYRNPAKAAEQKAARRHQYRTFQVVRRYLGF